MQPAKLAVVREWEGLSGTPLGTFKKINPYYLQSEAFEDHFLTSPKAISLGNV